MKKFVKGIGVAVVAASAIAVNIIGYQRVKANQQEQHVEQVASTIISQEKQLEQLQTAIQSCYLDESEIFLRADLTADEVMMLEKKLVNIQTTAEDFGIRPEELPANAKAMAQEKTTLQAKLQSVVAQFQSQVGLTKLFTNQTIDWQTVTNDVVLATEVTNEQIEQVKKQVAAIEKQPWQKNLEEYISFAQAQSDRINELQKDFEAMLVDGEITEAATLEAFYRMSESVAMVRNPELKSEFLEQLDQISQQLGLGNSY